MRGSAVVDHAIVDALHVLLEGARDVYIVGELSDGARDRLGRSVGAGMLTDLRPHAAPAQHAAVVVLDSQWIEAAQGLVNPGGTLTVAAANPTYGSRLVAIVEGGAVPRRRAADRDDVCERLESSGWTVEAAWPVAVPLALIPFDPVRVPKTVLAYLYACHPEIEIYCFLLQARRSRRPTPARAPAADRLPPAFPTIPWRTEGEWRELAEERPGACAPPEPAPTLPAPAPWGDDELIRIKSSLAWRAVVRYRVTRDRLLPPETRRGRLYARALSAIVRGAVNGHRGP